MMTASLTSSWGVVNIAVERLLVVAYPLKVSCILAFYLYTILTYTMKYILFGFHGHVDSEFDMYV